MNEAHRIGTRVINDMRDFVIDNVYIPVNYASGKDETVKDRFKARFPRKRPHHGEVSSAISAISRQG